MVNMKQAVYTVSFMIIITIVLIAILAFFNESSQVKIAQNTEIERSKSLLYAFNIFPADFDEQTLSPTSTIDDVPWKVDELLQSINKNIKLIKIPVSSGNRDLLTNSYLSVQDSIDIYAQIDDNHRIVAYGFPLKGKGLWGTISAFGVISADLSKMIGIDFTEQVETPGLGARIIETEFKYFFRHLDIGGFSDEPIVPEPIIVVKKKNQSNIEQQTNSLQAITGATQTVSGVVKMVNTDLRFYIEVLRENEDLIRTLVG